MDLQEVRLFETTCRDNIMIVGYVGATESGIDIEIHDRGRGFSHDIEDSYRATRENIIGFLSRGYW